MCCNVLQCVSVCCSVLQRVVVRCSHQFDVEGGEHKCVDVELHEPYNAKVCCSVLHCDAARCSALQCGAMRCRHQFVIESGEHRGVDGELHEPQNAKMRCSVLQYDACAAECWSVLQCVSVTGLALKVVSTKASMWNCTNHITSANNTPNGKCGNMSHRNTCWYKSLMNCVGGSNSFLACKENNKKTGGEKKNVLR